MESCYFAGDDAAGTRHFGYFENDTLLGVASLYEARDLAFADTQQAQLRGMAVLEGQQGKGIGQQLLETAESYARVNGYGLLWFNARENAVNFYKRHGFELSGERFEIPDVGPHYKMFKSLVKAGERTS